MIEIRKIHTDREPFLNVVFIIRYGGVLGKQILKGFYYENEIFMAFERKKKSVDAAQPEKSRERNYWLIWMQKIVRFILLPIQEDCYSINNDSISKE